MLDVSEVKKCRSKKVVAKSTVTKSADNPGVDRRQGQRFKRTSVVGEGTVSPFPCGGMH